MISEDIILNIATHVRACYQQHSDAWAIDLKPMIRSRAQHLTTTELRVAFETYSGQQMHPNVQREQIVQTLDGHLKNFIAQNIDPRTGASLH